MEWFSDRTRFGGLASLGFIVTHTHRRRDEQGGGPSSLQGCGQTARADVCTRTELLSNSSRVMRNGAPAAVGDHLADLGEGNASAAEQQRQPRLHHRQRAARARRSTPTPMPTRTSPSPPADSGARRRNRFRGQTFRGRRWRVAGGGEYPGAQPAVKSRRSDRGRRATDRASGGSSCPLHNCSNGARSQRVRW